MTAETNYLFSSSSDGFFDRRLSPTGSIASDAVTVSDADYAALLEKRSAGQLIRVEDGEVVAVDRPLPSRENQRKAALAYVDAEHANYLVTLAGGATVAERDTWKVKEEAARAFEAGTATPGQTAMLAAEAQGAGITEAELAATIIAKADAFLTLIGLAAGLRAKGRAAIMAATDEAVPLDGITKRIDQVFSELNEDVQAAIASFQSG